MAAAVLCGNKRRSVFEEDLDVATSKRPRYGCSSSSFLIPPHQHVDQLPSLNNNENNVNGGNEWVELFVREMSSATSVDDAMARAAKALEVFEQWISSRCAAEAEVAAAEKEEENMLLKQEIEEMKKENMILKRGVYIQNERLKEMEGRNQELEQAKELVNQYREQVSKLEVANYGLELHLKQAQCNNSIPFGFHPHNLCT